MAKFSQVFGLGKRQSELDFVDIDVHDDLPLYLDPYALTAREDIWSLECQDQIASFFQAVLVAIRDGNDAQVRRLLSYLTEPYETHLGVSKAGHRGRGVGAKQADQLAVSLANSQAAKSGLLEDLSDCALFVEGIGRDKISDICTNLIRKQLIAYTQSQCVIHKVPMENVASGFFWNPVTGRWEQDYVDLPVHNDSKLLLVPKYAVRRQVLVDHTQYRDKFVLEYLQEENLRLNTNLVTVIRDKKTGGIKKEVVYKKDVARVTPTNKDYLAEFSLQHKDILDKYRDALRDLSTKVPDITLMSDADFDERAFARQMVAALGAIPEGSASASVYHAFCISALSFLLFPNLIYPKMEAEVNEGRKRIDVLYTNGKDHGFFYRIATDQFLLAHNIHVECKNYSKDVANPELDQLIGRFDQNRGRVGLLLFRHADNYTRVVERCSDTLVRQRLGLILPIDDDFLKRCLNHVASGNRRLIDGELDALHRRIVN